MHSVHFDLRETYCAELIVGIPMINFHPVSFSHSNSNILIMNYELGSCSMELGMEVHMELGRVGV